MTKFAALCRRLWTALTGRNPVTADPLTELRDALRAQIERDERTRNRGSDHG